MAWIIVTVTVSLLAFGVATWMCFHSRTATALLATISAGMNGCLSYISCIPNPNHNNDLVVILIWCLVVLLNLFFVLIILIGVCRQRLFSFRQVGIKMVYLGGKHPRLNKYFENAKDIKMIFTTGHTAITKFNDEPLKIAMGKGCQIQLIIASVQSHFIQDIEELHAKDYTGKKVNTLNNELEEVTKYFEANMENFHKKTKVTVGYFRTQFRATILIFDNKYCFYTATLPPKNAVDSICFEVKSGQFLRDCLHHFESILAVVSKRHFPELSCRAP